MSDRDTTTLFTRALNVINSALVANADATPYRALIRTSEKLLDGRRIGVAVYESDPSAPFDYFTICFREGSFELVSHGKQEPDVAWKVSRDYLEKVADHPDEYVEHPAKLDWDWLRSRLGLES